MQQAKDYELDQRTAKARRLRYVDDGTEVVLGVPMLAPPVLAQKPKEQAESGESQPESPSVKKVTMGGGLMRSPLGKKLSSIAGSGEAPPPESAGVASPANTKLAMVTKVTLGGPVHSPLHKTPSSQLSPGRSHLGSHLGSRSSLLHSVLRKPQPHSPGISPGKRGLAQWSTQDGRGTDWTLGTIETRSDATSDLQHSSQHSERTRHYHLFLSHQWHSGQDVMRIVKQRLLEMIPDASVFLDVDDLEDISDLEGYVDRSSAVLVFCSKGYFQSRNCMRELLRATVTNKPIIAMLEPEASKGGLTREQIRTELETAESTLIANWGLDAELAEWGVESTPSADEMEYWLFQEEPIEWNRLSALQDVTMRLVARRMIADRARETYLQGEISRNKVSLPSPRRGYHFHAYASPSNAGAAALLREVASALTLQISVGEQPSALGKCECMLLYLNACTWTSGPDSAALAKEVQHAMACNVPLLLAHELPGIGGQAERHGCEFADVISSAAGATPPELLRAGIYGKLATPLKGGPWRASQQLVKLPVLSHERAAHCRSLSCRARCSHLRCRAQRAHVRGPSCAGQATLVMVAQALTEAPVPERPILDRKSVV